MSKQSEYRARLRTLTDWDDYLLEHSGLPGPRGNLELLQAVADEGTAKLFRRYLTWTADRAPANTPEEFLACCGVVGLGRLLAEGGIQPLRVLRTHAADPRWRVRESVAMALQRLGDADLPRLLAVAENWAAGTPLEQRAAAAAVCEPRLLVRPEAARAVLALLDQITTSLAQATDRREEPFKVLRQGLAYCWSVAVAALPDEGRPLMEKWLASADLDVRWVMRQNLAKARLSRVAPNWVARWQQKTEAAPPVRQGRAPVSRVTSGQVQVRPYRTRDRRSCRQLWVELVQRHREIYLDPTIGGDDPGKWFDKYLADPTRRATWVAEVEGQVVGMAGLLVHGEEAEVEPVIVASGHRSRGIGKALVQQVVAAARGEKIRFLNVRPVARNAEAIAFFTAAGFDIVGHVELFQDLNPEAGRQWKRGLTLHRTKLRY